ncbi:unnamed protein product [Urochloa decumbens]|uniref:F-box domain-containing protein n=1 Tax=Urochloa decumbens TaxID=240449 RepID=A0ABC8VZW8_9POAL
MAASLLLKFRALIARCFLFLGSAPAPALALEDDDLLLEILLRLPPLPSSILRASLVCKRWRRLVSDPGFSSRFRAHHRTPPLLGFFTSYDGHGKFVPTLGRPDRIPGARFSLPTCEFFRFLGCRHGLALLDSPRRLEAVVWDPITRRQTAVAYPPEFTAAAAQNPMCHFHGTVLGGDADAHGTVSSFRLLLLRLQNIGNNTDHTNVFMCLYESGTGKWGNISCAVVPRWYSITPYPHGMLPSVLVDNTLCGFLHWPTGILEFDLDSQSVGVIQKPESIHSCPETLFRVVHTDDRGLGLAVLEPSSIKVYGRRKANSLDDGIDEWMLQKTIQLDTMIQMPRTSSLDPTLRPTSDGDRIPTILGFDEDNNAIHLATATGVLMIQLDSMQFTKLSDDRRDPFYYYPYTSFFTLGN